MIPQTLSPCNFFVFSIEFGRKFRKSSADAFPVPTQSITQSINRSNEYIFSLSVKTLFSLLPGTGDCSGFIASTDDEGQWSTKTLVNHHVYTNKAEVERILSQHPEAEHGTVIQAERLLGQLFPLRAFGDCQYKWPVAKLKAILRHHQLMHLFPYNCHTPPYLTAEPEVRRCASIDWLIERIPFDWWSIWFVDWLSEWVHVLSAFISLLNRNFFQEAEKNSNFRFCDWIYKQICMSRKSCDFCILARVYVSLHWLLDRSIDRSNDWWDLFCSRSSTIAFKATTNSCFSPPMDSLTFSTRTAPANSSSSTWAGGEHYNRLSSRPTRGSHWESSMFDWKNAWLPRPRSRTTQMWPPMWSDMLWEGQKSG